MVPQVLFVILNHQSGIIQKIMSYVTINRSETRNKQVAIPVPTMPVIAIPGIWERSTSRGICINTIRHNANPAAANDVSCVILFESIR